MHGEDVNVPSIWTEKYVALREEYAQMLIESLGMRTGWRRWVLGAYPGSRRFWLRPESRLRRAGFVRGPQSFYSEPQIRFEARRKDTEG